MNWIEELKRETLKIDIKDANEMGYYTAYQISELVNLSPNRTREVIIRKKYERIRIRTEDGKMGYAYKPSANKVQEAGKGKIGWPLLAKQKADRSRSKAK